MPSSVNEAWVSLATQDFTTYYIKRSDSNAHSASRNRVPRFAIWCFSALVAAKATVILHLHQTFVSPNDVSKVVIPVLLCPLQRFPLILLSYNLTVRAATESLARAERQVKCQSLGNLRMISTMVVSVTGSDFSSLDALITLLHKLAVKEFASKRLPQHCVIGKQIKALLQTSMELQPLSAALVSSLLVQKGRRHLFQVALWPQFHRLHMQDILCIRKSKQQIIKDIDLLLLRKATQDYSRSTTSTTEEIEKRQHTMAVKEENTTQYTSGYEVL